MNQDSSEEDSPPDMPSKKWLSLLAALVMQKHSKVTPEKSVDLALKLWTAAGSRINAEYSDYIRNRDEPVCEPPKRENERHDQFPADFSTFLMKVVKGRTVKEREDRFREYLRQPNPLEGYRIPTEEEVESKLNWYRTTPILDEDQWNHRVQLFKPWRQPQKKRSAQYSASHRKKKRRKKD